MNNLERYSGSQVIVPVEQNTGAEGDAVNSFILPVVRHWRIALLGFALILSLSVPVVWLFTKPSFETAAAIRVAPILTQILSGQKDEGEISNYQMFLNTQADLITSTEVLNRVADELAGKNLELFGGAANPVSILKKLLVNETLQVTPGKYSELIKIRMKTRNPRETEQVVNSFVRAYMAIVASNEVKGGDHRLGVLENERKVLEEKLQAHRQAIMQMAQEYGTEVLSGRQQMMLETVSALQTEFTKVQIRKIGLEAQVKVLEGTSQAGGAPESMVKMRQEFINNDLTIQALTENLAQQEQSFIAARQILAPTNPELERKSQLIEILRQRLAERKEETGRSFDDVMRREAEKAERQQVRNAQAELGQVMTYEQNIKNMLANQNTEAIELGRKQLAIQDLQEQLNLTKQMYETVQRRINEVELERKNPARISVAYEANTVLMPDKRIKYLGAMVFGALAGGIFLSIVVNRSDRKLHTPEDVTKWVGARIIGTTTGPEYLDKLQLPRQVAEDYQTIVVNLELISAAGIPKKLVVTSPAGREGKTTLSINLATSLAKSGKKVLLIDGDLRKPDIARLLNLPAGSRALQEVLFGRKFEKLVCSIMSESFDVLSADSRNAADACKLLSQPQVAECLDRISQNYDHVIIDTPPMLAVPDALLWARMADAVILSSFSGHTTSPDIRDALERLAQIKANVLGIVLNCVHLSSRYYRYGYDYAEHSSRKTTDSGRAKTRLLLLPTQSQYKQQH